jgi:hypothetical protein
MLSKKNPIASADSVINDLGYLAGVNSKGMTANTDDAKSSHVTSNDENQWCSFQQTRTQYILACKTLIDSLTQTDPRTYMYFDTTGFGGIAVGSPVGAESINACQWGPYLVNGGCNIPTPLVTSAEAMFLAAEANMRLGNTSAATLALQTAIQLNIQDVTSGVASGATQAAVYTTANTSVHTIILEKWKAMFGQPIESYCDYRRTGYPVLVPNPTANVPYIPKRMLTPLDEQTYNHSAPIISLGVPEWFAQ